MKAREVLIRLGAIVATAAVGFVAFRPAISNGIVARGDVFFQGGQVALAMMYYDRALWLYPANTEAAGREGTVMCRDGSNPITVLHTRMGTEIVRDAYERDPHSVALLTGYARCLTDERHYDEALPLWRTAADDVHAVGWQPAWYGWVIICARKIGEKQIADEYRAKLAEAWR